LLCSTVLKNDSWVLPDKKSSELLEHEQGHFDFAMLCSREFEKAVRSTTLLKINYPQKIDSIFKATLNKYKQMEIQYDTETNHMFDRSKQAEWNRALETMLKTP
jgi:predicted secreted Zn-dependent protease